MERVSSLATARLSGKPEELKDVITLICGVPHTFTVTVTVAIEDRRQSPIAALCRQRACWQELCK